MPKKIIIFFNNDSFLELYDLIEVHSISNNKIYTLSNIYKGLLEITGNVLFSCISCNVFINFDNIKYIKFLK
ncbi:hypothetical protein QOZ91_002373 [Clostridium sardiniense]|nr:hypothetical protein [Clostridium sardiniense]